MPGPVPVLLKAVSAPVNPRNPNTCRGYLNGSPVPAQRPLKAIRLRLHQHQQDLTSSRHDFVYCLPLQAVIGQAPPYL